MNTLTQFSLISLFYLAFLVIALLYCKYGKSEKWKTFLKEEFALPTLISLITFNVIGLIKWLVEML